MFTGIVEAIGTVESMIPLSGDSGGSGGGGAIMTIHSPPPILAGVRLGDSISVSGTCLTVTKFDSAEATFTVGLAPETLRRTTLGLLVAGSRVNLERAMGGGGADDGPARFGGHYVQGHVDCVAEVRHVQMDGESRRMRFAPTGYGSHGLMRYIVEKGFICVDGASLTVTAVGSGGGGGGGDGGGDGGDGGGGGGDSSDGGGSSGHAAGDGGWFEVMLVAYTQEKIVTAKKSVGELVNIEVDLTGKLVEKQIIAYLEGGAVTQQIEALVERIVERKLREAGLGAAGEGGVAVPK